MGTGGPAPPRLTRLVLRCPPGTKEQLEGARQAAAGGYASPGDIPELSELRKQNNVDPGPREPLASRMKLSRSCGPPK